MRFLSISIVLVLLFNFASCQYSQTDKRVERLEAIDFEQKILSLSNVQLLDVRTREEFDGGHLKNAINIDWNEETFESGLKGLNKELPVFVYCLSGGRSASAAKRIAKMGFTKVYDLKGGILAWQKANLAVIGASNADEGLTMEQYKALVKSELPVLVDFYAPWCGPCKKMVPMLKQLSTDYKDKFVFVKVNADKNKQLMKELEIAEIPTLLVYRNGMSEWEHIGLIEETELLEALKIQ